MISKTEATRSRSELRFQRLVEQSPLSTQVFAPDGSVRQVNAAWERLWGGTAADLETYNILEDPELERLGLMPLIRRAFAGEAVTIDPVPYVIHRGQFAGQTRWVGAHTYPVKDRDGQVEEVVLVHIDLTDRKRSEAALKTARERWELAVRATQDGIWDWNLETGALYWSPRCKEMLGYADDELQPGVETVRDLLHPDDRDRAWDATQRHLRGEGPVFDIEYRLRHRDGSYRWMLCRGTAMRDAQGRAVRMIGSHADITDRKRAESALSESQSRLEALFETAQDAILFSNDEARYVDANPAACELTGYTREELLERTVTDLTPGVDRELGRVLWARFVENGRQAGEYRLVRKDGTLVDVEYRAVANILPGLHLSVLRDVSERKRAEAALRQTEERLRLGLSAGNMGIWDWDITADRIVWSEQIYQFHGLAPGEFGGRGADFLALVHPADRGRVEEGVRAALRDGGSLELEFRTTLAGGEERWLFTTGRVFYDDHGRPVRMMGAIIDITERRRTELALSDSEERFRVALKNTSVCVYTNDRDLRYTWIYNPRFGYPVEEIIGKRDGEILPMESIAELVAMKRRVLGSARGERGRISTTVFGEDLVFDVTVEPLIAPGSDGEVTGVTVATMDVTDLMRAKRAAEEASRAKDQFLAVLSHELRTPLTPVLLTASLLESRADLPDDVRAEIADIRRNVELESRLISDLLDLTRIEKGKLQLDDEEVDLHRVVRSAIDICQREASARLLVDLSAERAIVRGDGTRLQQVFWNLVNNAQKFTPDHGEIRVRSSNPGGGVIRVEVSDTGAGIDAELLPRLFSAFEQGNIRAARLQAGLGLGLAITRRLVDAHGGSVSVHSDGRGRGATFTVELPVLTAPAAPALPAQPDRSRDTSNLSVLLVEDHEPTLRALVKLLRQLGHRVTPVTTRASALAAARQDAYDVVISDLGLPDGSGLEIMRLLREEYAGRAIALTGYGMESDVEATRAAGFAAHLTKPVDFDTLESALARVASACRGSS